MPQILWVELVFVAWRILVLLGQILSTPFRIVRGLASSGPGPQASQPGAPQTPFDDNTFERSSPARRAGAGREPGVLIDWTASKKTWDCNWFTMLERRDEDGNPDTYNNLFAEGGPLDKYDAATGQQSRSYELVHGRVGPDAPDAGWRGHCNNAAQVSCMLPEPRREITEYNGQEFTKNDIAGLLVVSSDDLLARTDWVGKRNNGRWFRRDPNDPNPELLLSEFKKWTVDGKPFVMDIDRGSAVWNYAYDQLKVSEQPLSNGRRLVFDVKSTGYEDENLTFIGESRSRFLLGTKSVWLDNGTPHPNPDFAWRPHPKAGVLEALRTGDDAQGVWRGPSSINPKVRLEDVFQIYRRSLQD